jgi:hypothetical protein
MTSPFRVKDHLKRKILNSRIRLDTFKDPDPWDTDESTIENLLIKKFVKESTAPTKQPPKLRERILEE